jgi:hypothetical protein
VRTLVRGGGDGAALPKGHSGPCGPKGHLGRCGPKGHLRPCGPAKGALGGRCEPKGHSGRCDDWDGAAMPPRAASAESSPSLTAQLAPRKAAPG